MNKEELYAEAKRLNIPGRSKMTADQLREAIANTDTESVDPEVTQLADTLPTPLPLTPHRQAKQYTMLEAYGADLSPETQHRLIDRQAQHAARMTKTKTSNVDKTTPNRIKRMARASHSRQYGQAGRGMGAKHFASGIRSKLRRDLLAEFGPENMPRNKDADKPLSYRDRVRHYTKQNGTPAASADNFPGAALTNRQWRRLHKKAHRPAFTPTRRQSPGESGYKEARYA